MSLYDVMFRVDEEDTKAGSFITKDGRVIFVGGPGSGGGSGSDRASSSGGVPVYEVEVTQDSNIYDIVSDAVDSVPFGKTAKLTLIAKETGRSMDMYVGHPSMKSRIAVSQPITRNGESWYRFGSYGISGKSKGKYEFSTHEPEWLLKEQGRTQESGYLLFER